MSTNTMRISTDNYEKFKNIMHPNLRHNIKRYLHNDFMKFHFITDVIKKIEMVLQKELITKEAKFVSYQIIDTYGNLMKILNLNIYHLKYIWQDI